VRKAFTTKDRLSQKALIRKSVCNRREALWTSE